MLKQIGFINGLELSSIVVFYSGNDVIANILKNCISSEKVSLFVLKKLRNDKATIEKELAGHKSQFTVQKQEKRDSLDFRAEGDLFQLAIIDKMIDIVIDFNNFDSSSSESSESEILSRINNFMDNNLFITYSDLNIEKIINSELSQSEVMLILGKAKNDVKNELSSHQPNFRTKGNELLTLQFKSFGDRCHIKGIDSLINKLEVAYKN